MAFATSTMLMAAAGTLAVSSISQGIQAADQAEQQAAAYEQQAQLAQQQGEIALYQQQQEAMDVRRRSIAQAGRGSSSLSGSYLENLNQSMTNAELDKNSIEYNSAMSTSNYLTQADNARSSGDSAMMSGLIGAGSSILSGYNAVGAYNSSLPVVNATGAGVTGGNVNFTNASYGG